MARTVKQKHGGELRVLEKGDRLNPNGRPRKYVSLLKEQGYNMTEINAAIKSILSMNLQELSEVLKNKEATILEQIMANALLVGLRKGNLDPMEKLLTRSFGAPKEVIDATIEQKLTIVRVKQDAIK
jgi:hypothetical protein